MKTFCFALAVASAVQFAGCASEEVPEQNGNRAPIGKADLYGSCAANDCGAQSAGGNCWCDEACLGNGDCCSDKATTCPGGLTFATYNAGLAHGAVPFAEERLQPIIDELEQSPADVMCLNEVWTDADAEAIKNGVKATFPHAFREVTKNDDSKWFACGPTQWPGIYRMNSCVSEKCTPSGISAFECAADQCKPEWDALQDNCKLCISANTTSPLKCAAWKAPMFANEGRNGLMLLSRTKPDATSYTPFETYVIKRGVIRADVSGYQVQCTHMTADLPVVPYPAEGRFGSWQAEHAAQVSAMAEQAGKRRRTVLLGDLNAGPASPGVDAELPANYTSIVDAGYRDTWTSGQQCTYCQDNPLACSRPGGCPGGLSSRLDHALLKNFDASISLEHERNNERAITIVDGDGRSHATRLSDHFGVLATLPY
jgi:endonuclease/exonuclease/phosphatase family metal-dependent hydrolase